MLYTTNDIINIRSSTVFCLAYAGAMPIKLNHTIVHSTDKRVSAEFFASLFNRPAPVVFGPFLDVDVDNEVTLAFLDADGMEVQMQHYAFLVSEEEFDQIFSRVKALGMPYGSEPYSHEDGRINTRRGGRGFYFEDPNGHLLEVMTVPETGGDDVPM